MSGRHGIVDAAVQRAGLSRRQWVHLQCGVLVKPLREADTIVEMLFRALFDAKEVRLPYTQSVRSLSRMIMISAV